MKQDKKEHDDEALTRPRRSLPTRVPQPRTGDRSPLLKWAGGKRWQVPHLKPLWAAHGGARLVEPFCGGLSIALGLQPERAVLNDVNPHLINFYCCVQAGTLGTVPTDNEREAFNRHRARFNTLARAGEHTPESAALFFYLNKTGFNGLCRFNSKGEFNVPFGKFKTINYERDWPVYAAQFSRWTFTVGDFASVPLQAGDFVYADPPYDVQFTTYSAGGFTWADQVRAAEWLAAHDGPVVLANQATPRIEALYRSLGFDVSFLAAPRRISCTGDRTPAREVFATRNLPAAAVEDHSVCDAVGQPSDLRPGDLFA